MVLADDVRCGCWQASCTGSHRKSYSLKVFYQGYVEFAHGIAFFEEKKKNKSVCSEKIRSSIPYLKGLFLDDTRKVYYIKQQYVLLQLMFCWWLQRQMNVQSCYFLWFLPEFCLICFSAAVYLLVTKLMEYWDPICVPFRGEFSLTVSVKKWQFFTLTIFVIISYYAISLDFQLYCS